MKREIPRVLILDDNDMNCDPKNEKGLEKMTISDIGFSALVIKDYALIVYQGKKGTKILKNTVFGKLGIVG
jgi:hypothetical protein